MRLKRHNMCEWRFVGPIPTLRAREAGRMPAIRQAGGLRYGAAAFSLVEILVAVSLLAVIMVGLLAMFYQTQRAFRLGNTQVDVIETGRATMQMLAGELKQMVPGDDPTVPSLITRSPYPMLTQWRSFSPEPQQNWLKEIFFMMRENDQWVARGYFVNGVLPQEGGAGMLHRFSTNIPVAVPNAFALAYTAFTNATTEAAPRLAERVIHLNLYAFDQYGDRYLGNGPLTNLATGDLDFRQNLLPAYVEVELGILEPRTYERFKALYNNQFGPQPQAVQYLTSRVERVHLFRQRIPIRNVHETLF